MESNAYKIISERLVQLEVLYNEANKRVEDCGNTVRIHKYERDRDNIHNLVTINKTLKDQIDLYWRKL